MNFLAHAYLSFEEPSLIVGNVIADMIKGKQIEELPHEIRQGVYLHRQIDLFTDTHPVVKETKLLFENPAGRYSGLFLDVSFDHFLAKSSKYEPPMGWEDFSRYCYSALEARSAALPSRFVGMFMYMKSENWLLNYRHKWLIETSFERVQSRASYLDKNAGVYQAFEDNYEKIDKGFELFFPDLVEFVDSQRDFQF